VARDIYERALWLAMREGLGAHINLRRIENLVGVGDPDVYWCAQGIRGLSGWLELKVGLMPTREHTKVFSTHGMEASQINRIEELLRHGACVHILTRVSDCTLLLHGAHAPKINSLSFAGLCCIADWMHTGKMNADIWASLANRIMAV